MAKAKGKVPQSKSKALEQYILVQAQLKSLQSTMEKLAERELELRLILTEGDERKFRQNLSPDSTADYLLKKGGTLSVDEVKAHFGIDTRAAYRRLTYLQTKFGGNIVKGIYTRGNKKPNNKKPDINTRQFIQQKGGQATVEEVASRFKLTHHMADARLREMKTRNLGTYKDGKFTLFARVEEAA